MRKPSLLVAVALFVATLLLAIVRAEAQTKQTLNTKPLTLGLVFQGPAKPVEERFHPLVDYAARKLSPPGEIKGMIALAPTTGQMMKLLDEKRVDFYMESPYATYLINRLGAAKLLVRRWKGGLAESKPDFHQQRKRYRAARRSAGQNPCFRRPWFDFRLFSAQTVSAQEGIFRGGKTRPRWWGFHQRNWLHIRQ